MKVFTQEFVAAVLAKLGKLEQGSYLTREQVCVAIGVTGAYSNAISMLMAEPEFARYETVKSRGIRIKKDWVEPAAIPSDNG